MKTHRAVLRTKTMVTHNVLAASFKPESPAPLKAGQFINLKIEDDQPGMCFRAYSLASGENDDTLDIIVKILDEGRGSAFLKNLTEGQSVEFLGPIGHFTHKRTASRDVLIATGTGVVPYISFLRSLSESDQDRTIDIFWGLRHERDVFERTFFEDISKKHPNITMHYLLTRPDDSSKADIVGRVSSKECMDKIGNTDDTDFYICGNPAMVDEVQSLLSDKGVGDEHLFFEKY